MASFASRTGHGRPALLAAVALAVLLAVCAAVTLTGAGAELASAAKAKTIGKTKRTPKPSCPKKRGKACEAVGSVTGFQTRAGKVKNPFKVREDGRLVAWSIDLSRPKASERRFFGKLYRNKSLGTSPAARISVLKRKKGKRYKLMRHGPTIDLSEYLGQTPIFTLGDPLRIRKGDIVALTLPTWVSAFAIDLSTKKNKWRASRSPKRCELGTKGRGKKNLDKSRAHEKDGSKRTYGCNYRGARLLYWGYYEPSK